MSDGHQVDITQADVANYILAIVHMTDAELLNISIPETLEEFRKLAKNPISADN